MLNKKAQISETMTWIIATIAIITILLIFIYASSILAEKEKVLHLFGKSSVQRDAAVDWLAVKTIQALDRDSADEPKINKWIEEVKK